MSVVAVLIGAGLLAAILWDTFETVILPRRVTRRLRPTRLFYSTTWRMWSAGSRRQRDGSRRETYLALYGPLSLLGLFALWAAGLILSFALLLWGLGPPLHTLQGDADFIATLYMSGTNFFTLGLGDITPAPGLERFVVMLEAGTGFGFLGLVISYLPVMYQAFSRRESTISLLDARAGTPHTAVEFLRRHAAGGDPRSVDAFLFEWERWAADLLESHLSYPFLGYFRSQHEHDSWVAAVTVVLDTCALVLVGVDGIPAQPARFAFAMSRHAVVDLCQIYNTPPVPPDPDRLSPADLAALRTALAAAGIPLRDGLEADRKLAKIRAIYEPYVNALARHLLVDLPPWLPAPEAMDNWQATAWDPAPGPGLL